MKTELTDSNKPHEQTYRLTIANLKAGGHQFILFQMELRASNLILLTRHEAEAMRSALVRALHDLDSAVAIQNQESSTD